MDTATILAEINKLAQEVQKSQCSQTSDLMSTEERRFFANETRQRENTKHVLDRVHDGTNEVHAAVEKNGSDNMNATLLTAGEIKTLQENIGSRNAVHIEKVNNELSGYFYDQAVRQTRDHGHTIYKLKDLEVDIGDYFNSTQKEVLAVGASVERQSSAQFAKLQSDLLKVEHSLGRQSDAHFAALQNQASVNVGQIQIQALQLNKELVKQMADCCCEIKEAVGKSESNITSLITSNEAADLRARLTAAETQNIINSRFH